MTTVARLTSAAQSSSLHQLRYHEKEAARVVRRCALCQDAPSVGGNAVAVFNTGASKPLKLSMVGLVLHHRQRGVFIRRPTHAQREQT